MSKVSVSKAAKLAGISRSHLYRHYIKTSKISLSKNERDQPTIDVSELLRVFGRLQGDISKATPDNTQNTQSNASDKVVLQTRINGLEALLAAYQEELARYREREQSYLESERIFQRLLENKTPKKRRWWPFGR